MKKAIIVLGILLAGTAMASAQYQQRSIYGGGMSGTGSNFNNHYVAPHVNSNGSVTGGHYQTNSNGTQLDNYGTRGNVNPYTGQVGTRGAYR